MNDRIIWVVVAIVAVIGVVAAIALNPSIKGVGFAVLVIAGVGSVWLLRQYVD